MVIDFAVTYSLLIVLLFIYLILGVFVEGKAIPGTMLAIYPGIVLSPADIVNSSPAEVEAYNKNEYLV